MVHLILGGRRSGKTAFAEQCARNSAPRGTLPLYVATAEPFDDEMSARIDAHQKSRGDRWRTAEVPIDVDIFISDLSDDDSVVIDCLTVWLTNLIVHDIDTHASIDRLCDALKQSHARLFIVSNETSLGICPSEPMSRDFLDSAGLLHQNIASFANRVDLVVAGLPLSLKTSS